VNRTPPRPEVVGSSLVIHADELAVVGTLARTYDAQRLRLLERAGDRGSSEATVSTGPLRALDMLEPAVMLDGRELSASIVDAVTMARELAERPVALPFLAGSADLMAAEAGWWDALLGDVERRTGLAPRAIHVALTGHAPESLRAIFAERVST
jgi:malate synthase